MLGMYPLIQMSPYFDKKLETISIYTVLMHTFRCHHNRVNLRKQIKIKMRRKHTFNPTAARVSVTNFSMQFSGMLDFSYLNFKETEMK